MKDSHCLLYLLPVINPSSFSTLSQVVSFGFNAQEVSPEGFNEEFYSKVCWGFADKIRVYVRPPL